MASEKVSTDLCEVNVQTLDLTHQIKTL